MEMKHINDNVLCAVAFRTSGPIPGLNDLLEIAIIPLDGITLNKDILPFNMQLRLTRPCIKGRLSIEDRKMYGRAMDGAAVAALFEEWYKKLNLSWNKRIIPVGYDLFKLHGFLRDWLCFSEDGEDYLTDFFDFSQARSLETISHHWNDLAWFNDDHYPFNKHQPSYTAWRLGYLHEKRRSVVQNAFLAAEVYNRFVKCRLRHGVPLTINYPSDINYLEHEYSKEEQELFDQEEEQD